MSHSYPKRVIKEKIELTNKMKNSKTESSEKVSIMIWDPRPLNDFSKKIFLVDIVLNKNPDIIILIEHSF